jgi:RNA polymerase sigma-70 factor (ECF subfamily)
MNAVPQELNESEWIRRIVAGETDLFERILERYRELVFGVVGKHVPPQDVEGVAYDVFIEAHRSLARFSGQSPFSHWLSKIAVRRCCDYWRRQGRRREAAADPLDSESAEWLGRVMTTASREEFEREADRNEAAEVLQWALGHLGEKDRMVLSLIHLEGRSVAETSELTGWSRANVKIRAWRARQVLRRIVTQAMEKKK